MFETVYDEIVRRPQKREPANGRRPKGRGVDLRGSAWTLENEAIFGSNTLVA